MKSTTVVLVVLNSYVRYGEDLEPIDELERKVRNIFAREEKVSVVFLISNEKVDIDFGDRFDAIAFFYPRMESLYSACEMGKPILNFDGKANDFKFVGIDSNGLIKEVNPNSSFEK